MLTLDKVLNIFWVAIFIVREMKKHSSSALSQSIAALFVMNIMILLVLNVLVSIIALTLIS